MLPILHLLNRNVNDPTLTTLNTSMCPVSDAASGARDTTSACLHTYTPISGLPSETSAVFPTVIPFSQSFTTLKSNKNVINHILNLFRGELAEFNRVLKSYFI